MPLLSVEMPPSRLGSSLRPALRPLSTARPRRVFYSTDSGPVLRVTDIPAPNSGHIRILELNRPAARNAISRALLSSLRNEIDAVHSQYDASTGDEIQTASWNQRFGGALGDSEKGPTRALIVASAVDESFLRRCGSEGAEGIYP